MAQLNATIADNLIYVMLALGCIVVILLGLVINLKMNLSDMQRRYKKMMVGVEGADLEKMVMEHVEKIGEAKKEQKRIREDVDKFKNLIGKAITRIAIVRYNAFRDDSSELSYCIALLDEDNTGVIISTVNGREITRSYAKAIVHGACQNYKLTKEEEQALREAAAGVSESTVDD